MKKITLSVAVLVISLFLMTSCALMEKIEKGINSTTKSEQTPDNTETQPRINVEKTPDTEKWEKTVAKKFLKISEIRTKKISNRVYETEVFTIVKAHKS